jgi:hypothetical protein
LHRRPDVIGRLAWRSGDPLAKVGKGGGRRVGEHRLKARRRAFRTFAVRVATRPIALASGVRQFRDGIIEMCAAIRAAVRGRLATAGGFGDIGGRFAADLSGGGDVQPVWICRSDCPHPPGDDQLALAAVGRGDLDPSLLDRHRRAGLVDRDGEHGALDERDEIRGADAEMRRVLLLDAEDGAAIIFEHLDDAAAVARFREAQPGAGRDDHIILAADQHGAGAGGGLDHVAGTEDGAAVHLNDAPALADVDPSRGFGDAPCRFAGRCGGGGRAQSEEKQDAVQRHGDDLLRVHPAGAPAPYCAIALKKAEKLWLKRR